MNSIEQPFGWRSADKVSGSLLRFFRVVFRFIFFFLATSSPSFFAISGF